MENTNIEKYSDFYETIHNTYDELLVDVKDMEAHSTWVPGIMSKEITVNAISGPLFAQEVVDKTGMDYDLVYDTADTGTKLYATLPDGTSKCIRDSGRATLFERACIFGSALGRETPEDLATILNLTLKVAKGPALLLDRWGKISAFHSDAAGGYRIMPISQLLGITLNELRDRFGEPMYIRGSNSHSFTAATWTLPDIKDELIYQYEDAVRTIRNAPDISRMMPAVRFSASDTATSSAILQPLFQTGRNNYIQLCDAIRVKHSRTSGMDGVELYEKKLKEELFTRFTDAIEGIKRLSEIYLFHPENVVVGLCNKLRISKKCGDTAREQAEMAMVGNASLTAYDVFLMLGDAIGEGMSSAAAIAMQEKLYSVMNPAFDWCAMDVGGIVAWNTSASGAAA